jgi:hypothetical protein
MFNHSEYDNMMLEIDAIIEKILASLEEDWAGEREGLQEVMGTSTMLEDMLDIEEEG